MAVFTVNTPSSDSTEVVKLDLSIEAHTFTFKNYNQFLVIENGEASAAVATSTSCEGVTTFNCPGSGSIDLSAGFPASTPADGTEYINTSAIRHYLGAEGNTVTVTTTGATTGNSFGYILEV